MPSSFGEHEITFHLSREPTRERETESETRASRGQPSPPALKLAKDPSAFSVSDPRSVVCDQHLELAVGNSDIEMNSGIDIFDGLMFIFIRWGGVLTRVLDEIHHDALDRVRIERERSVLVRFDIHRHHQIEIALLCSSRKRRTEPSDECSRRERLDTGGLHPFAVG